MEDRKRPALTNTDDLAPPSKRHQLNGGGKSRDDGGDTKDEAWIEDYQKDAIYRQMLEYKRDKVTLEARLEEVEKKSTYHDDHLRIIDAWWLQLLQELELIIDGSVSTALDTQDYSFPTGVHFQDSKDFQKHLGEKAKSIKSSVDSLLGRLAASGGPAKSEASDLQSQLNTVLASVKEYHVQVERLNSEKESLSEQLDTATLRYIKAEKKLDRAKSAQVQKLEQQALANATSRPAPGAGENGSGSVESSAQNEALQLEYQEAVAVIAKQKEQVELLRSENKSLQDENSTIKTRKDSLTDEDYARSDIFRQFKARHEDLIKNINNLEAVNKTLREEAEKYQAERTSFRTQLEREAQAVTGELEDQVQAKEHDLTRIRSVRDELVADLTVRKASQEQERTALEHIKELVSAKEDRITALELELERLRPSEDATMSTPRPELEALSVEELREKYLKLEKDFASIQSEVPSVEKAYKKAISLAQKKTMDFTALEDKVQLLILEKGKADQKYFAARKDTDIRTGEIRALRHQNSKSSEIIQTLKDVEAQNKVLLSNLEKQLVDFKQSNATVMEENRTLKASNSETLRRAESAKSQIADLTNLVKSKDAGNASMREQVMDKETECEKLRVRLDHVQKDRDSWKGKCLANSSEEEEMLRKFATCPVCRNNFKDAVVKTCGHVFCHGCLETRLSNRMRKCPTCNKAFDKMDVMAVHL
ncbi:uncharacterized protein E0L32_005486 [Thyridium curvatum]|uniref:E3 ubiquitin protein ligase n=1 Tax=Thyridium curvatum TaxID=1093900 RepID=A0A507BCH2_9PEZI|nr:uncharacterized protein E0L32_005486 [Thyridium curvatum]TPX14290.1 hypothetical protein E0L32_005486 [Thyridium curvatum]